MKIPVMLAGAVLLATSLAACSGSDSDGGGGSSASGSYCKDIKAAKSTFDSLGQGNLADLDKGFAQFHELADEAPDDIKAEWKTLDEAATSIEKGLKSAGIKLSDLAGIQAGKIPPGVDVSKLTTFAADLQKLNTDEFTKARTKIASQAKSSCNVDLGSL